MSNMIANQLESRIRNNRLMNLPNWGNDEIIFPYYEGLSLRNIPHTIADLLGAPLPNSQPLLDAVWQGATPHVQRVMVILLDGMGYKHLNMVCDQDPDIQQLVDDITQGRGVVPTTSIAPSTTVAALTSLWSGAAANESGIIGTIMYLPNISTIVNMLTMSPITGRHPAGVIADWDVNIGEIVGVQGIAQHLALHDIPTYVVLEKKLIPGGLSRILQRGVLRENYYPHYTHSDFHLRIRDVLNDTRGERCYINAYWSAIDGLAHLHGAHNEYTRTEIKAQLIGIRDLLNTIEGDGDTLVIITADHGHYNSTTPIELQDDPVIANAMTIGLWGDQRFGHLRLLPHEIETVKQHINDYHADKLIALDIHEALACGLLGNGETLPHLEQRLGDLLLIPRLGYVLQDSLRYPPLPIKSKHAGLDAWEMLTPFMHRVI